MVALMRPVPDGEDARCEACENEATPRDPVFRVRVEDLDGQLFTQLHRQCMTGLVAHGAVDLDADASAA